MKQTDLGLRLRLTTLCFCKREFVTQTERVMPGSAQLEWSALYRQEGTQWHSFRLIRRQFGRAKVCCRDLKKITAQMLTLCVLSSHWLVRNKLLAQPA